MRRVENLREFDTVIILDACRYDYFSSLHPCERAWSPGRSTWETIPKMFPYRYDAVYVSANPYINSKNILHPPGWKPTEHFRLVEDVWSWGWENVEGVETVPPWNVAEAASKWQRKGYKTIIHFMQPHAPYIGEVRLGIGFWSDVRGQVLGRKVKPAARQEVDHDLLRKAYRCNLELVLRYAWKTVDGETIITSDHGELLGELNRIGHPTDVDHPKLHEVPYLEVR